MFDVRPSTADDFVEFAGELPCYRARSWTAIEAGRIIGIGGYGFAPNGAIVMFMKALDGETKRHAVSLCKLALCVLAQARQLGRNIVAECDDTIPAAKRFLEWLGFVERGGVFEYEGNA